MMWPSKCAQRVNAKWGGGGHCTGNAPWKTAARNAISKPPRRRHQSPHERALLFKLYI